MKKKWYQQNDFAQTPAVVRSKKGKWFHIGTRVGIFYGKYCQIASGTYKFIGKNGNRITDDNKNIIAIKEYK